MAAQCYFPATFLYMERIRLSLEFIYECGLFAWKIGHLYEDYHFNGIVTISFGTVSASAWYILDGNSIYRYIFRCIVVMAKICISTYRTKIARYFERYFAIFGNNSYLLIHCMDIDKKYSKYLSAAYI
jgi:hypothetical protein